MFRGRFAHTVDTKGRVAIPASFRAELDRRSDRAPILTNMLDCLALYSHEDWTAFENRLIDREPLMLEGDLQRFMIAGCAEAPLDSQGRILIPPFLREHARLEREVTIAGVGPRIEIWDKVRFDEQLARTQARFGELSAELRKSNS